MFWQDRKYRHIRERSAWEGGPYKGTEKLVSQEELLEGGVVVG
jgi:hypothetical protein